MAVLQTGQTFASGQQVTADKLMDIANDATFITTANETADGQTIEVDATGGYLKVPSNGIGANQLSSDASNDANRAVDTNHIKDGAVTAAKLDSAAVSVLMPTASLMPYAGSLAPTGYLLCDGAAISRTTYSDLFGIIGLTYGAGDGSTTFNIPDLRGRVIAGQDDMGGISANRLTNPASTINGIDGDGLGNTGGHETHTLTSAQMTHNHNVQSQNLSGGGGSVFIYDNSPNINQNTATAHNNVQPTIILNYIIKT